MTPPRPPDNEAANIAGGSAIVMAGGLGERVIRMVLSWLLARWLGPVGFGLYTFVQTLVATIVSLSALGTDGGIVFFGARYRKAGEHERLKGTLLLCLGIAVAAGTVCTLAVAAVGFAAVPSTEQGQALAGLRIGALSVGLGTALAVLVGGLIAARDMRGQALTGQLGLPLFTLLLSGAAVGAGHGVDGALWALAAGYGLAAAWALILFWRRFGPLLRDRAVVPRWEPGALLRYSLPQSLARSLYQANLRVDILMLTAMASLSEVGVYKIATMIAQLGALPVMASTTMFGPVVSELVYARETIRLQALLRVVTRWLLILSAPLYLGLILLPDALLALFDEEYRSGGRALAILLLGQAVYVAGGPSGALVTMGGYSGANLLNGLVSVGLNLVLNTLLIPRMGMEGAALASAISIVAWTALRVLQARWLLGCTALDGRVASALGLAIGAGALAAWLGDGQPFWARLVLTLGAIAVFAAGIALGGSTPEDRAVLERFTARLRR